MIENDINLDPAMLKLKETLLQQYGRPHHDERRYRAVENISRTLNAYADQRGTSRPINVKWGGWRSIYDNDTDTDIVVSFELSAHFPRVALKEMVQVIGNQTYQQEPAISREMSGFEDDLHYLEETAVEWGKGIIDRIAESICLVPATLPDKLVSWLSKNCDGRFYLTELDPNPRPHNGFASDAHCYPYFAIRCLSFENEGDAVLFKLSWM